jgi:signal transduction histidine kinase
VRRHDVITLGNHFHGWDARAWAREREVAAEWLQQHLRHAIFGFGALIVFLFLVLLVHDGWENRGKALSNARGTAEELARIAAGEVGRLNDLAALAAADAGLALSGFERWRARLPVLAGLMILDADGRRLAQVGQWPVGEREPARVVLPAVGHLGGSNEAVLVLGSGSGRPVLAALHLGPLEALARTLQIGAQGSVALVRGDGTVLWRFSGGVAQAGVAAAGAAHGTDPATLTLGLGLLAGGAFGGEDPLVVGAVEIPGQPLSVVVALAEADVLDDWRHRIQVLLGVWLGLAAVVALLSAALAREVWRREQSELRLGEAKEEAERANLSKSEFLANMSHELRTPLNAIIGFSEIIDQEVFGRLSPPRYGAYVRDIHDSGQHLLELIDDLLDLARVEAGAMDLWLEPVEVAPVIRSAVAVLSGPAKVKAIEVEVDLPAGLPALAVDRRRLSQMLLNLLSNAIKFSGRCGTVGLRAEVDAEGGLEITVSDQGIGMSASEIAQVIQPFRQVEGAFSRCHGGVGLGLPLTRRLIELHGGRLAIDSVPGRGTRVHLVFPANRVIVPPPPP